MRIAVLGGGPGGYSAAFEAARLGADVVLVERERLGGTCLNWGCIPTKTILRSAHIVGDTRHAAEYGLKASPATVDTDALRLRKEAVVDELVGQVEGQAKRLKVEVVLGEGRLTAPKTIEVALYRRRDAHGRRRCGHPRDRLDSRAAALDRSFARRGVDERRGDRAQGDPVRGAHHRRRRDRARVCRRVRQLRLVGARGRADPERAAGKRQARPA